MNALMLVDLQNDFMPGGALAVAEGDRVVPIANRLMPRFDVVVATQDWHPAGHCSFASQHPGKSPGDVVNLGGVQQVLWPDHCVQGSTGAELHRELNQAEIDHVVHKGTDAGIDSYSDFYDNQRIRATGLTDYLRKRGVTDVYVMGLATDYCVKYTALDAVEDGFHTLLIKDGCRGVNLKPGDVEAAVSAMAAAGVQLVESRNFAQDV
ncbi:MAG: bifunctional nicotinamidase/pyrazinamidase [Planctomycetes bacterium]|nr:bifunctional nicotinamidase/pyrazinamidase [Planctomycetota bacterium]